VHEARLCPILARRNLTSGLSQTFRETKIDRLAWDSRVLVLSSFSPIAQGSDHKPQFWCCRRIGKLEMVLGQHLKVRNTMSSKL